MRKLISIISCLFVSIVVGIIIGIYIIKASLQGSSLAYIGFGHQYIKGNDYIRGIASFNKAVVLDPNSFTAHISLADAYYSINKFELALEEYENSSQLLESEKAGKGVYIQGRIEKIKEILREKDKEGKR